MKSVFSLLQVNMQMFLFGCECKEDMCTKSIFNLKKQTKQKKQGLCANNFVLINIKYSDAVLKKCEDHIRINKVLNI